jgi:hypothetical protein
MVTTYSTNYGTSTQCTVGRFDVGRGSSSNVEIESEFTNVLRAVSQMKKDASVRVLGARRLTSRMQNAQEE